MNKINLVGRLTKEPVFKVTEGGASVCNFSIAVNRTFKRKDEPKADFFNVVTFNKRAENCGKYLKKGSLVSVSGTIQNSSYTAKDGTKKYRTDVVANEINFLIRQADKQDEDIESNNNNNNEIEGVVPSYDYGDMPF